MEEEYFTLNTEFARYVVIVLAAPFWIPFIRKVWGEVENALREEGGVFGRTPTHAELMEIERQKLIEEDPLVNEPFVRGLSQASRPSKTKQGTGQGSGPAPEPRRHGFRS